MRVSPHLAALAVGVAIAAAPAIAFAEDGGLAPVESGAGPRSIVWVDPAEEHAHRTSTAAMITGIGLTVVGIVQIPIGVAMLTSRSNINFQPPVPRGGGISSFSDPNAATHRAGAILAAVGATAVLSGVGLTIWGASRKSQGTDVRVGLGSVAATYRF